ncbi:MAG: SagB family peptide dehydrogenase [Coprococcus sp.]
MKKWKTIGDEYHNYDNVLRFHRFTMHHKSNMSVNHIIPVYDNLENKFEDNNCQTIELTDIDKEQAEPVSFFQVLKQRRTSWNFVKEMSFGQLSFLLQKSFGNSMEKNFNGYWVSLRMYASAGALYSVEPYIYINNIDDRLNNKIWHYNAKKNCISYVSDTSLELVNELTSTTKFGVKSFDSAKVVVFYVADFKLIFKKYGALAYRLVLLEAGHMCQNLQLVSSGMGYASVPLGGFYDLEVGKMLCLDRNKICVYMAVVG